jgi:hypothetical protein
MVDVTVIIKSGLLLFFYADGALGIAYEKRTSFINYKSCIMNFIWMYGCFSSCLIHYFIGWL